MNQEQKSDSKKTKSVSEHLKEHRRLMVQRSAQKTMDYHLAREKLPTGEQLQKELESYRNVEKPITTFAWFKKMKAVGPRVGFLQDPLVKRLQRPFAWVENKVLFINAAVMYSLACYLSPKPKLNQLQGSVNFMPYGYPPEYNEPGELLHIIHMDMGKPKRFQM